MNKIVAFLSIFLFVAGFNNTTPVTAATSGTCLNNTTTAIATGLVTAPLLGSDFNTSGACIIGNNVQFNHIPGYDYLFSIYYTQAPAPTPLPSSAPPVAPALSSPPNKRVFITSTTYNGNLGGLTGADQKCQDGANAVSPSLGGTWKAWLSDSTSSPSTRFSETDRSTTNPVVFKLLDGRVVANSWANLTKGTINNPINLTETLGSPSFGCVTANTNEDGSINSTTNTCQSWTNSSSTNSRIGGSNQTILSGWSSGCTGTCDYSRPLYCFEQ